MNWVCSIPPCRVRVRVTSRMVAAAATVSRPPHRTVHHMVEQLPLPPPAQLQHRMAFSMVGFPRHPVMATRQAPHQASISTSTSSISIICKHIARRRSYTMAMNPTRMDAHVPSTSAWASPRRAPSWTRVPVSLEIRNYYTFTPGCASWQTTGHLSSRQAHVGCPPPANTHSPVA